MRVAAMAANEQLMDFIRAELSGRLGPLQDQVTEGFHSVSSRLDKHMLMFDELRSEVSSSLFQFDQRLSGVEQELFGVYQRLSHFEKMLTQFDWRLRNLEQRFDDLDNSHHP